MRNVLDACMTSGAKLVFFDSIYLYDSRYLDCMTEDTPVGPVSEKGAVRAQITDMLMNEVRAGNVQAMIVRSADFYGPSLHGASLLTEMVFQNYSRSRKANWLEPLDFKHSFTYTPDAGRATALLGNTDDAYNQVWHLPTAENPLTGGEWLETIAHTMNVDAKYLSASKMQLRLLGLFVPIMKEMVEMYYQYDRNYIFDSSKFLGSFDFNVTSYREGIEEIVRMDYTG